LSQPEVQFPLDHIRPRGNTNVLAPLAPQYRARFHLNRASAAKPVGKQSQNSAVASVAFAPPKMRPSHPQILNENRSSPDVVFPACRASAQCALSLFGHAPYDFQAKFLQKI
jgi:hypothetical protein